MNLTDYQAKYIACEQGRIMIATEAGAEGINLQFSSLVVNYDLPWNPQRIEQRIGRCHRYGQQHDVVVVNFLNRKNAADQRVFQLLSEKFKLFEGVFGASDEVLGAIESGVDFEKRIAAIYQRCRKPEDIQSAFDQLQLELSLEINEAMTHTRNELLENFDDEVREKLRVRDAASKTCLGLFERQLMRLTRYELNGHTDFISDSAFRLNSQPFPDRADQIPLGLYELPRRTGEAHLYRRSHPLAEAEKLDGWADDLKVGLEREIKELDRQIKEARRAATAALTLEEKLIGQKQIKDLEAQRNQKRRSLFDAQDDVDRQRETLIEKIEGKLQQRENLQQLFLIRWLLK